MNTYNLNLSSVGPQPRIPGLHQLPPIANTAIWKERLVNSKGLATGTIARGVDNLGTEAVDVFKIRNLSNYDWSHCIYNINPAIPRDNETIGFEVWTKTNLDTLKFRAGIAEGNEFGKSALSQEYTSTTPISTNGDWKLFKAEKVLTLNDSHKKPNIFFGNGYDAVGETVWAQPKITFSRNRGVVDVFTIPDHYGATKLNLNFVNLYDDDKKYIKILISHNQTDEVWMLQEFSDIFLIKAQQFPVYLYPTLHEVNEYIISVSAVRTDLQVERFDIYANIKRPDITNYGDIDIVQTRLYNNAKQSNNLYVAMETENPRYLINSMLKLPDDDYSKPNINLTYFDSLTAQFPVYTFISPGQPVLTFFHGPSNSPSNHFIKMHEFNVTSGDINQATSYMLVFDAQISNGQNYYAWNVSVSGVDGDVQTTGSWSSGKEIPGKKYSSVKPLTHEWTRHYVPISAKLNDIVKISMVSSNKAGNPTIASPNGQTLGLKNVVLSRTSDVTPHFVPVEL